MPRRRRVADVVLDDIADEEAANHCCRLPAISLGTLIRFLALLVSIYYFYVCHSQKLILCSLNIPLLPSFLGALVMSNTTLCTNAIATEQSAMTIVGLCTTMVIVTLDMPLFNTIREVVLATL
jgi:hypothetical protein